jgi:hypothetical protein
MLRDLQQNKPDRLKAYQRLQSDEEWAAAGPAS